MEDFQHTDTAAMGLFMSGQHGHGNPLNEATILGRRPILLVVLWQTR